MSKPIIIKRDGMVEIRGAALHVARCSRGMEREALAAGLGVAVQPVAVLEQLTDLLGYPAAFFQASEFDQFAEPGATSLYYHESPDMWCALCLELAEALCDFPMGRGKRCDLRLCYKHRVPQGPDDGPDLDYCAQHAMMAAGHATPPTTEQATPRHGSVQSMMRF